LLSYLSTPYKSTIEPYKENVNLIAQVAQQKQSKYDQVLSTIFQKQNQLLDLDLSGGSEEAELKKDNLLKEADNQLNKMASSDLTIPDNINKVENIFSPIVNDKDIMNAASITAFTKEQTAYFDEWTVKPFVAVGGEWTNLAGQDEWHSTLTLGAKLPKGFQGRFTRLHLNPQGYRLGADWTKHVSENIGVRFSSDFTVNRHAKDVHVISLGLVHY
jgi:hypothetical protein